MARINLTAGEARAVLLACEALGCQSPGELLDKVTDGDERALEALRVAWPRPTRAENTWRKIVRLSNELRELLAARGAADLGRAAKVQSEIKQLRKRCPDRPVRIRASEFTAPRNVIDFLLELARTAPRLGAGRPSVADGIRVLLEGGGDA